MAVYGIVASIFCLITAYVAKLKYSRPVSFLVASLIGYTVLIVMLVWEPKPSQMYLLYILPSLSGISDAITEPFVTGLFVY
jgi:uncharacterized membrane protein YccC